MNCSDGSDNQFDFNGCTFNGDLVINGGKGAVSDAVNLNNCIVNGNIIVKDDDGNTLVNFSGTTVTHPGTSTVTVTEKTAGAASDAARLGLTCGTVKLNNLPSGIRVINSCVSVSVLLGNQGHDGR